MLRKANFKDVGKIEKLINFGAKKGKVLKRDREEIKKVIGSFFVWEDPSSAGQGEILGCISLEIYSKKLAEIRSLVVSPKYQKKGIGTALIKKCLAKAKKEGIYEVLAVTDKVDLFEQLGFSKQLSNQWPLFIRFESHNL